MGSRLTKNLGNKSTIATASLKAKAYFCIRIRVIKRKQWELNLMKMSCVVVYLSSAITAPNMCNSQLRSILLDLSTIYDVHLVARTRPGCEHVCSTCQACRADVTLIPIGSSKRQGGFSTHVVNFIKTAKKLATVLDRLGPKCIYAINLDALVAVGCGWLKKVPVVYHALEIYYERGQSNILRSYMCGLERKLANYVDIWVVPSQLRAKYYVGVYQSIRTLVWLNAPSISELSDLIGFNECHEQRPNSNNYVYTGGLGDNRDLKPFLYAMRDMCEIGIDVSLSIYTNSYAYINTVVKPLTGDLDLADRVAIKEYKADRVQLIRELCQYDTSLVVYGKSALNQRLCAPTKLVDSMIAETLWLGTDLPGTRSWLEEFGGGTVCNTNSRQAIVHEVLSNAKLPYKVKTQDLIVSKEATLHMLEENLRIR